MIRLKAARLVIGSVLLTLLTGCYSAQPINPSFPVSFDEARDALNEMRANPRRLPRPLVIVGGFMDPNVSPPLFDNFFRGVTGDTRMVTVSIGFCTSFDECRKRIIDAVDEAYPSADPQWTTEVDVVGASLGGLASRYAAAPSNDPAHPRRLRIARLFSISSPHAGATLAEKVALTDFHRDMRPGSAFLKRVAEADAQAKYELYPYVHLGDEIVGEQYAAPPGVNPFWLSNLPLIQAHAGAMIDPRILADISRRLRGELPFTKLPAVGLPGGEMQ
jgi:hypothetical protein